MSGLMNAPVYNERAEKRKLGIIIGVASLITLCIILTLAGYLAGHGWFFTNLPAEWKVDKFFTAVEEKDFDTAYGIYVNNKDWKSDPSKYAAYPIKRFTEDWTIYSKYGEIKSHHVDISRTDGEGTFGTSIIVGTTINGGPKKMFMSYIKKDGTLSDYTYHIIQY